MYRRNTRLRMHQQNKQREINRRRVQFSRERRGVIESEGDTLHSEGEGLCSSLSESGTRRPESKHENRPD